MELLSKTKNIINNHWIAIVSITGTFIVLCIFTFFLHYSFGRSDIIFEESLNHLPMVENYFEGRLTFNDFWGVQAEHRLFGYRIIYLLNVIFFGLIGFVDYYLNALTFLITTILIYVQFNKVFSDACGKIKRQLLFLPIVLVMLGLANWGLVFNGGMIVTVVMGTLMYIPAYIFLSKLFSNWSKKHALFFIAFALGGTLIFGGSYFIVFYQSLCITYFIKCLIDRNINKKTLALIAGTMILGLSIYMWNFEIFDHVTSKVAGEERVPQMLKYFFLVLGNSVVQTDLYEAGFNNYNHFYMIGAFVLTVYLYSIRLFLKSGLHKKTYLPIFLMADAFGLFIMVMFLRSDQGLHTAFGMWWYAHIKFGFVGLMWIYFYSVLKRKTITGISQFERSIVLHPISVALLTLFLLSGNLYTNYKEPQIRKYRVAVMANTRNLVLFDYPRLEQDLNEKIELLKDPTTSKKQRETVYYANAEVTSEALRIMKKYSLNIFSDIYRDSVFSHPIGSNLQSAFLPIGWHLEEIGADQKPFRWIEPVAKTVIKSGDEGKLTLIGYTPEIMNGAQFNLFINDKKIVTSQLKTGHFSLEVLVPANENVYVVISIDSAFQPENDVRKLSIIINELSAR